jgi:hypothetical protein
MLRQNQRFGENMLFRSKPQSSPEHWSRDFAEHLRTVHFSLITVAAGLILLLTSKVYDQKAAAEQVDEVIRLNAAQLRVREPHVLKISASKSAGLSHNSFDATIDGSKERIRFQIQSRLYRCDESDRRSDEPATYYPFNPARKANTLSSFKLDWNFYNPRDDFAAESITSLAVNGLLLKEVRYRRGEWPATRLDPVGKLTIDDATTHVAAVPLLTVYLSPQSFRCGGPNAPEDLKVSGQDLSDRIFEFNVTEISRGTVSRPKTDNDSVVEGDDESTLAWTDNIPFDVRFPDLAKAAKGRMNEDFTTLVPELHAQADKGATDFEVFGMKLPSEQVTRWGIVVLLSIQLYLFMYLKRLSSKLKSDDPAWDVPWMAMDQSTLARAIYFMSIVVFPLGASLLLFFRSVPSSSVPEMLMGDKWWDWFNSVVSFVAQPVLMGLAVCISVALAALSWRYRPKLSEPPVPWQRFE